MTAMKTAGSVLGTLAVLIGLAFAAIMLAPALLGYERYVILTGSMTGTYDPGSIVYAKPVPTADLRVGDVITYAPPPGNTPTPLVTHRIASIDVQPGGQRVFRTKGDANAVPDGWTFTLPDARQARVSYSVPYAGLLISALSDRRTRMLVIGVPAGLIALLVLAGLFREGREAQRAPRGPGEPAWTRI
jgi:signal peptidase